MYSPHGVQSQMDKDKEVTEKLNKILAHVASLKAQKEKEEAAAKLKQQTQKYDKILPMLDDPLRNGGGTPRSYQSAIVTKQPPVEIKHSATNRNADSPRSSTRRTFESTSLDFTSSFIKNPNQAQGGSSLKATQRNSPRIQYENIHNHFGDNNSSSAPSSPNKFKMGSPSNGYISKTTFSTAFDHCYNQTEKELAQGGPTPSPSYQLKMKSIDKGLPSPRSELTQHQHPYKNLLEKSQLARVQEDEALEKLRAKVVNQLRLIRSVDEIEQNSASQKSYEYAQGVKVSLPLESENIVKRKRGKRVFHDADDDVSPVSELQNQTARSPKEGLITRRKHIPNTDNLTLRLTKRKDQIEDTSIFAEKNSYLRAGLASIETKGNSPRGVHQ